MCEERVLFVTLLSIAVLEINQQRVSLNEAQLGKTGEESSWQEPLGSVLCRRLCGSVEMTVPIYWLVRVAGR